MKIYHVKRNFEISLAEQKKQIMREYKNVSYISSDGRGTITVFASEWRRDDEEVSDEVE